MRQDNFLMTFNSLEFSISHLDGLKFIGTYKSCVYYNVILLDRVYIRN